MENALGAGVSSALQSMQMMQGFAQIAQTEAGTRQVEAATRKIISETYDLNVNTAYRAAELRRLQGEALYSEAFHEERTRRERGERVRRRLWVKCGRVRLRKRSRKRVRKPS